MNNEIKTTEAIAEQEPRAKKPKPSTWQQCVPATPVFEKLKDTLLSKIPCEDVKEFLNGRGCGYLLIPATKNQYNAHTHGLLTHSLISYYFAIEEINKLAQSVISPISKVKKESMMQSAWLILLADVYKWDSFRQVIKPTKVDGRWMDSLVWDCHDDGFPFGQSEKSIYILDKLNAPMSKDEVIAIRWCRSAMVDLGERASIVKASQRNPLVAVFATAKNSAANWKGSPEDLVNLIDMYEETLFPNELEESAEAVEGSFDTVAETPAENIIPIADLTKHQDPHVEFEPFEDDGDSLKDGYPKGSVEMVHGSYFKGRFRGLGEDGVEFYAEDILELPVLGIDDVMRTG